MSSLRILVLATCVALSLQSCCMPAQWQGQIGYQALWYDGGKLGMSNNAMFVVYDATNMRTYTDYGGNFPFLPGVESVIADFNSDTYWMTMTDGKCTTGPFEPVANTMPMCIPAGSPAFPFYLGFDVSSTSYDVSGGSPTVTSYITAQNPTCTYLTSSTLWNNSWGTGTSLQLTMAFQNLSYGITDPSVFTPPADCTTRNAVRGFTPVAGVFVNA